MPIHFCPWFSFGGHTFPVMFVSIVSFAGHFAYSLLSEFLSRSLSPVMFCLFFSFVGHFPLTFVPVSFGGHFPAKCVSVFFEGHFLLIFVPVSFGGHFPSHVCLFSFLCRSLHFPLTFGPVFFWRSLSQPSLSLFPV